MALFLGLASVAHAQTTTPTVSTVAITSNPGSDNTYTTLDVITVGVTFSEAVTVTGTPQITLDIGGTERTADYSGAGTATGQLLFSYTVQPVDQDDDGVAVKVNSLALNGGTIQSADDSTSATLTHSAIAFPSHKVDTELVLISNMGQADGTALRINAGETVRLSFDYWNSIVIYDLNQIVLDVKTLSDTLNLALSTVIDATILASNIRLEQKTTFAGSVATAGRQTFKSNDFSVAVFDSSTSKQVFITTDETDLYLTATGTGYVELGTTASTDEDAEGAYRWSIGDSVYKSTDGGTTYTEQTSAHLPRFSVVGHTTETLRILAANIVSEPYNGTAYVAGERIEARIILNGPVRGLTTPLTVSLHLGEEPQHLRQAKLVNTVGDYTGDSLGVESPKLRTYSLYFAYTVQTGDVDADGIVLGADPLGTESDGKIEYGLDTRIRMDLSFPAQTPGDSQRVDGSQTSGCVDVHCANVIAGGTALSTGYSVPSVDPDPGVIAGGISGRLFSYGGHEYFLRQASVTVRQGLRNDMIAVLSNPLQERAGQRLGLRVGDLTFAFADHGDGFTDTAPTSEEEGFEQIDAYIWPTTGSRWNIGERVLIKIVEMPVTATFDAASYAGDEGGSVEVTVTLGGSFETKTVTLPIRAAGSGGATAADYSGIPANLVFPPGDTEKSFTVTLTDDDVDDDGESLTLSFGAESNIKSGGANETATIAIRDDDDPDVTVSFGVSTYTAAEGGTATVTVTLSADPERTVEVRITATNQGGATSADYSGVPASVTFDAGDTSKTFHFAGDPGHGRRRRGERGAGLRDDAAGRGQSRALQSETTVSITDDDDPGVTVSFGAATYTAAEGSTATVTVELSADPERTVAIPLTKTNQGGATADDYSGVPATVTFNAGDTSKTFDFAATQDTVDDDDESVDLAFGTLPARVSAGSPSETTVSITDDDDPQVTVNFGAATYTAAEGSTATVTLTLSADPERTVDVPITTTNQGGASSADYSGVPGTVTFNSGQTSKTVTFSATQDTLDDDGESVKLGFGASLPAGVSAGSPSETTISITDDDDPAVTVQFSGSTYRVVEGGSVPVRITLNADPERTVAIPLTVTNQNGATAADYSGVPTSVTFNAGETFKTFDFAATDDVPADTGESVRLTFGTLPTRVSEGSPNQATVTIKQVSTEFVLNCSLVVWCADIRLSDGTAVDWGWSRLRYEKDWDPPATISDDTFIFRGVEYTFRRVDVHPGTHPTIPNAWSRTKQGYSYISLRITRGDYWDPPAEEHYRDWVLHLDGVELPFKDAFRAGDEFQWMGVAFQQLFNDWTSSTVTKFGIEEIPATEQEPTLALPYAPIHVEAWASGRDGLYVRWDPPWWRVGVPDATGYIVQWKKPDDSWSDSAAVSQREVRGGWQGLQKVDGLTEGTLYSVRVFATNAAGDGPPSEDTLGRPQPLNPHLVSMSVNGRTLTMRYDRQLDQTSVPAETAFVVLVNGGLRTVDAVAVRGMEVVLTLAQGVSAANSVIARYEPPTDPSAAFLRDTAGNHVFTSKRNWLQEVANETPRSSLQPLTASFSNVPSSHDGSGSFTFNIVFSEQVWIGTGFPRAQLLVVTGGTVTGAHWLDRRTGRWAVTIQPDGVGDIVITLPKDRYCVADLYDSIRQDDLVPGAPCAAGNRPLTNEPTATVPGPPPMEDATENTPAEGAPRIQGDPDVGETLSADTTGISDADGLNNAVFEYQWLADEAEIDGATSSTHTLTSGDAGKAITVRVDFTDDAGNEESLTSAATAEVAAAGLQLRSATLDGATLTLTYNETLDEGGSIPGGAFTVTVAGSAREVTGVSVSGSSVTLTLASEAAAGDAVTVDYTRPEGRYFIRDTRGRVAPSFSGRVVSNDTAADEQSTSRSQAPGSPRNLAVVRHESGKLRASWDAPDSGTTPTGYTVQWKESGDDWAEQADVSEAQVTGTSHVITGLTDGVEYAVRVIASTDDADSAPSGDAAATPRETVPPAPSGATVDGTTLTITFSEGLTETPAPAAAAFTVNVGSNQRGVNSVAISGSTVTLTLASAVTSSDQVSVSYTVPTDTAAARLKDLADNPAASFALQAVTNNTAAALTPLTASIHDEATSHDGQAEFTFELRFSENLESFSFRTLRDHAFTVTGGEVQGARRLVSGSNIRWEITVMPSSDADVTIVLPITTDCTAQGAVCTGDGRKLSNRLEIIVSGPRGRNQAAQ